MKVIPENSEDITTIIASEFRCFGGNNVNKYNPISVALEGSPACFAAGVDVQEVVDRVIELWLEAREHMPSKRPYGNYENGLDELLENLED